jgi:multidrug efflux system membrane fusion protein
LNYCYVRAPFDGYVTNLNIAAGQYANQGVEVFALVDDRNWYVMANFSSATRTEMATRKHS